jgi:hypothetical protein
MIIFVTASRFQKFKCEEILMNWKTLLVIASLSLSAGLTACNKEAAAPDATKTDTTTPAATETKPADGAKDATKTTKTETTETKPVDAMKDGAKGAGDAMKDGAKGAGDAMKDGAKGAGDAIKNTTTKTETKTETKPAADAPKKP